MMGLHAPNKYVSGLKYQNPQLADKASHLNPRVFGSAEKV